MSMTKQELDAMWAALRPLERAAVVAFRATGVKAQAARFVGRDARWLDKQQRRRPIFAQAMDSTELTVQEARARFTADLAALAEAELAYVLRSREPVSSQRLAIIRLAVKLAKDMS